MDIDGDSHSSASSFSTSLLGEEKLCSSSNRSCSEIKESPDNDTPVLLTSSSETETMSTMSVGTLSAQKQGLNSESAEDPVKNTHQSLKQSDFAFQMPAPISISLKKTKVKDRAKPFTSVSSSPTSKESKLEDESSKHNDEQTEGESLKVKEKFEQKKADSSAALPKPQALLAYTEPSWSSAPDNDGYSFDVLKNGRIIGSVSLSDKSFHVFGRLPSCDVTLEHPTLSRYHAVMQFSGGSDKEKGWYIYDLDSTHGTWVNKRKIPPKTYLRVKVGYLIKFGGSTRLHILQGPSEDQDEESELTFTEMKDQRERLKKEADLVKQMDLQAAAQRQVAEQQILQDRGCSWGMGDDAEEPDDETPNFATLVAENEDLYIDDPKKALKGFYEREGCDLPDYQFSEAGYGKHKCILNLPVDGPNGEELVAEATVSGKRKDAVVACALEACRILDKLGMLRSSTHESRKRKQKKWEDNDFYDSDEDTFLDRTGAIEKKRALRMKKAGKDETETYETLIVKYTKVKDEIQEVEAKLAKAKAESEQMQAEEGQDELEAYMNFIKSGCMDPKTRIRLKGELMKLTAEEIRLRKLVNIAKPASLPPLKPEPLSVKGPSLDSLTRKVQGQAHHKGIKKTSTVTPAQKKFEEKPDDFEEDEDDDDEPSTTQTKPAFHQKMEEESRLESRLKDPESSANQSKQEKKQNTAQLRGAVKGPALPPSMLAELAKGKTSAEAFESAQKALSSNSSRETEDTEMG